MLRALLLGALVQNVRSQACAVGAVSVTVGAQSGDVTTTAELAAGESASYSCATVNDQYGGNIAVSCADDGSALSADAQNCMEVHVCHDLSEVFVTACDTSAEDPAGDACPVGCMEAYEALVAESTCADGWQEPVSTGGVLSPFSRTLASSFGLNDGTMPWGIQGAWTAIPGTVENTVRWVTLLNRLQERCVWRAEAAAAPDYATDCAYRYFMAVEVLSGPGEALEYNCAVLSPSCTETATTSVEADATSCAAVTDLDTATACEAAGPCTYTAARDVCTDECRAIKDAVLANCDETDTYTNSAGIVADYSAMVGGMNVQMSCAEFECELSSLGEAFCGTLDSLGSIDGEAEDATGTMQGMSDWVDVGCNSQLSLAPVFMALLPQNFLPPRALDCITQLSTEQSSIRIKNVCACTMTEMCPGDDRFYELRTDGTGRPGGLFNVATTSSCTLVPSTNNGVTPGSCTDSEASDTAYCNYSPVRSCWSTGTLDVDVTPASCTSTDAAGVETSADTEACYLDSGTCSPNDGYDTYTCAYVPEVKCSSTGAPDTEDEADSCTATTVVVPGSPAIDCSGAPGVDGADCPTGCIYAAAVSAACEGTADDGATDCSTLAADTACTVVAGCTLSALQEASCGDDIAAGADSGGVETMADTDNCNLTPSGDFGVTPGQCAAVDPAVATCAYVSGTYSVSAPMDFFYGESCTLITPPTAEQCVTGAFAPIQEEAEEAEPPPPPTAAPAADSSAAPRVVGMALLAAAAMASVFA
jgi:hypothetical protein